jgi:hypothetical protein
MISSKEGKTQISGLDEDGNTVVKKRIYISFFLILGGCILLYPLL